MAILGFEERKKFIGGSDIHHVFGLEPYGCARKLWLDKTAEVAPPELEGYNIRRGNRQEPVARKMFEQQSKDIVVVDDHFIESREYPYMKGNVDGLLLDIVTMKPVGILEIKCPGVQNFRKVKKEGLSESWILQMQYYLAILGETIKEPYGEFAIFSAELDELLVFKVEPSEALQAVVRSSVIEFWQKLEAGEEFGRLGLGDDRCAGCHYRQGCHGKHYEDLLSIASAEKLEYSSEFDQALLDYKEAKTLSDEATARLDSITDYIKDKMADRVEVMSSVGRIKYAVVTSNRWDTKELEKDMPELAVKYKKPSQSRRLTIKVDGQSE